MAKIKLTRHAKARRKALNWYRRHGRDLVWRNHENPDPYRVWLSEVMLQQTTVAVVEKRLPDFLARFPDMHALARARREDVMAAWAGLGYYARARNLHQCAVEVVRDFGGAFPQDEAALLRLPGIGAYTAAAIAAFAFGRRAVVVDANVERVVARWDAIATPLPEARGAIRAVMDALTPYGRVAFRAGDFAQSLMDIATAICTPRNPDCGACPLGDTCRGRKSKKGAAAFPARKPKTPRPLRRGMVVVAEDVAGNLLLERRGDKGLLGGMAVFPGSGWADGSPRQKDYPIESGSTVSQLLDEKKYSVVRLNETAHHVFTHFRLELQVIYITGIAKNSHPEFIRVAKTELKNIGLPTVMKKVARIAGVA